MKQYRILKTSQAVYTPQYKGWFYWRNFVHYDILTSYDVEFESLEMAREFLDRQTFKPEVIPYP